jgi:uncharacterized membrane protein YvbJ
MFCMNCGKAIEAETKFCPHCGARQAPQEQPSSSTPTAAPATLPASTTSVASGALPVRKPVLWAGAVALLVALVSAAGYWGWRNTGADDEVVRQLADEEQRRVAAEKAAETAEITAAQALLDKHIAVEEAQAQARALATSQNSSTTRGR